MNDHDQRQYFLMLESTRTPKSIDIDVLGQIIQNLNILLAQLQAPEQEWIDKFTKQWWKLEELHAFYLYGENEVLSEQDQQLIMETLNNIRELVEMKLHPKI